MFTSAANGALTVSANGSIMVTATGNPTPSFTETGALPMGVTFTDNHNGTATVAGTPASTTAGMTYTLNITAQNGVGTLATLTFTLNIVAAPSITTFTAAKTTITAGSSTTLTATFTGGTGSVNNSVGTVTSGTQAAISPSATTTYTLTVTNTANTSVTQQVTVTVVPAPAITSFTAGAAVITSGTSTMLTAVFTGGTGTVDNGVGTVTSGTHATVTPTTTTTYTLTVSNAANASVIQTVTVTVVPPPVISNFIASPTIIVAGNPSTLVLSFSNGTGVITNNVDSTTISATSGTPVNVTPSVTTIYTLKVSNSATTPATVTATAQVTVDTKPAFTSQNNATFTVGMNHTFTVTTTGNPTPSLSITSGTPPNNLIFTDNGNGSATIAGTPAANTNGTYNLTITATNSVGSTNQTFTLTVNTAPVFTSAASTTFTVGTSGSFPVTASGTPAPSITESGTLPNNVSFNSGTGVLGGVPQQGTGKIYNITFTASNGVGTPAVQNFMLTVDEAPMIISMNSFTMTVGMQSSFRVMTSGFPHPSISDGGATLPTGVAFTDNGDGTASLSGQPASGSQPTYTFTITASNGVGTNATQSFTLMVSPPAPIMISPSSSSLPNGTAGSNYSQTVTATGGIGPYTFALDASSAALPANLMLTNSASPNQGLISGTPATAGTTTGIIVDVTDSESPAVTQKMTYSLTINSADPCATAATGSEGLLSGSYAFVLKGFDNGAEPALVGGVLTFNGSGLISVGTMDMNLNAGVQNLTVSSGSYKIGSDHRACMTITTSAGTQHYRASLAKISGGVASTGHMINFDTAGPFTAGVLRKQSASIPTTLSGSFAFGVSSVQNTASQNGNGGFGGVFAAAGTMDFASNGTLTGGGVDFNQNGFLDGSSTSGGNWPSSPIAINSGSYSIAANGRGTFTFTPSSSQPVNTIIYVVSSSEILILGSDTQAANTAFGGSALLQSGTPFSANPLSGAYVGYQSGLGSTAGTSRTTLLRLTASGTGISGTQLRNDGGSFQSKSLTGITYSVASSGRTTVIGGTNPPIFYLVSASQAFFLSGDVTVESGIFQSQTATSVSGTYAFGTVDPENSNVNDNSGIAVFATPNVTVTEDDNGIGSQSVNPPQTFAYSADSTGLGQIPSGCTISSTSTTCEVVFYVISPTRAVIMDAVSTTPKAQVGDQ